MLSPSLHIPQSEIARFDRQMQAVERAIEEVNLRWLQKWALIITGDAKKALDGGEGYPRRIDDGTLRASIHPVFDTEKMLAYVISELSYAVHVHFGTGKYAEGGGGRQDPWVYFDEKRQQFFTTEGMPANPFLRRAFDQNKKRALADYRTMHAAAMRRLAA